MPREKLFPLVKYFLWASGVAITVVTALLTFDHTRHAKQNLLSHTATSNKALAKAFANTFWPMFRADILNFIDAGASPTEHAPLVTEIDRYVRMISAGLPILKVKVYLPDGRTLYSSEPRQIGEDKSQNDVFLKVVGTRQSVSNTSYRENFWSFDGPVHDRQLVETYHPIVTPDGDIGAIFELYRDVTVEHETINRGIVETALIILGLLLVLYLALSIIVRRADKIIESQYQRLELSREDLEQQTVALSQANEAAQAATKAKSEFLASMSHEIRTPMTGITGFAEMLLHENLPVKSRAKVEKIKDAASSLLAILNDILNLSKLDAGKLEIERINFSPSKIANDVIHLFYQTCPPDKRDSLTITAKLDTDFPAVIRADPTRLRQVLVNLVGNAVKFTDAGSVTLHAEKVSGRDVLRFRVVDTGIGIDRIAAKTLFEDFVQADASVSRNYHGTGLGLSICKRLVHLMGGEIGLESEPRKGSSFWFTLPYEPVDEDLTSIDDAADSQIEFVVNRALAILVAEDNEINQTIIEAMLTRMGHTVSFANNGAEAVEAVKSTDFDLVFMDVRMPELSGPDATRRIRQLPGPKSMIPVIALTADVIEDNLSTYFEAGMNDCVAKPIVHEQVVEAINKAVGDTVVAIKQTT